MVVPEGVWYTGPIELKDNTELHLEQNAVIVFSDDKTLYPLVETTFEGLNTLRCQSPISARGVKTWPSRPRRDRRATAMRGAP